MISSECNGCEYQCKLSHIDICTLGSPCPHQRSTPMTNEEWFINLPTKEKAKWLYDHYVNARADEHYDRQEKTLSEYQKWLVSVHREIDGTKID